MNIIEEIISKFQHFNDSIILSFNYKYDLEKSKKNIEIILKCMNFQNNYIFETIQIELEDVKYLKILDTDKLNYLVPTSICVTKNKEEYVIDFDPINYDQEIQLNPKSEFLVKCTTINYRNIN